jgi:CheY-like chemotaxis protein
MAERILLVEDNADDVLFMKRALQKICPGADLKVAANGEEAVAYLSGEGKYADRAHYPPPSRVLLDLKLPRMSGLEVLEWIRHRDGLAKLPVVILTSSKEPEDVQRAHALGIDDYLIKPVGYPALVALVESLCARWNAGSGP